MSDNYEKRHAEWLVVSKADKERFAAMQETWNVKRKERLDNKISHEEFFTWAAEVIRLRRDDLQVSLDAVRQSKDPYLNDIPLNLWDRHHPWVSNKAAKAGINGWSISDTVCVLKVMARQWATEPVGEATEVKREDIPWHFEKKELS